MRRLATTILTMALFIITAQPADAQRGRGQTDTGLQSVDDGSWHPEPLDPADGTILATFGTTQHSPEGATGRLIVNYLKTQEVARVNINVEGLEPGTYQVLMINHQGNSPESERFSLTEELVVDEEGKGHMNVVWFRPFPINAVNVNPPGRPEIALLSTIGHTEDGIQQQTPSNRGNNRGGGGGR